MRADEVKIGQRFAVDGIKSPRSLLKIDVMHYQILSGSNPLPNCIFAINENSTLVSVHREEEVSLRKTPRIPNVAY